MLIKSRATEAVAQKIEATMDKEIQIGVKAKVVHYLQLYLAPKKLGSTFMFTTESLQNLVGKLWQPFVFTKCKFIVVNKNKLDDMDISVGMSASK